VARLARREFWYFTKTAPRSYADVRFERGDVLVFGSESQGLPPSLLDAHRQRLLRIPVRPQARSLNLSNAVGIVTFEALRQWGPGERTADQSAGAESPGEAGG
jgi:tRNA (cytidine/uridine-2'-O-)-methyltransferase